MVKVEKKSAQLLVVVGFVILSFIVGLNGNFGLSIMILQLALLEIIVFVLENIRSELESIKYRDKM